MRRCTTFLTVGFQPMGWSKRICGDLYYLFPTNRNSRLGKLKPKELKREGHFQGITQAQEYIQQRPDQEKKFLCCSCMFVLS